MTTALNMRQFTPEMERIYCEARRYCDERGIEDEDGLRQVMGALAHREFLGAIEPYIKAKADSMACGLGMVLVHADGTVEHIPEPMRPEAQTLWEKLDEMIEMERQRYSPPGQRGHSE